jgi:predicted transcriptional regulator
LEDKHRNFESDLLIEKRAGMTMTKYRNQMAWRRNKVRELLARGYAQYEISNTLHISQPTISRDIHYLEKERYKTERNYGQRLFSTYESNLLGYEELIKKLWSIIDSTKTDDKQRIKAITLINECYKQRLELLKSEPDLIGLKHRRAEMEIFNT